MAVFLLIFFFFSTAKNGESLGDVAGVTAACLFLLILAYLLIFKSWLMQRQRRHVLLLEAIPALLHKVSASGFEPLLSLPSTCLCLFCFFFFFQFTYVGNF